MEFRIGNRWFGTTEIPYVISLPEFPTTKQNIFRDFPDVLARYRDQFRYVLVDEYQDTNYAQHRHCPATDEGKPACLRGRE